jgi:ribonuclease P protein component
MQARQSDIENMGRLRQRSDFLRVQQTGRKWVSRGVILQGAPSSPESKIRAGFTVSRRLDPSSVARNRIRRRLKSAACDILPVCAAPGMDYVLIGRPDTATRPYEELKGDLKWCLEKLACLQEKAKA